MEKMTMGESGLWFGVEGSSASSPAHSGAAPQPVKLFFYVTEPENEAINVSWEQKSFCFWGLGAVRAIMASACASECKRRILEAYYKKRASGFVSFLLHKLVVSNRSW